MKATSFFQRSELASSLLAFRREFMAVGVFSMVANLMMLTPSLYMLQVYDRVMVSRNEFTLVALSLITFFLFVVMAFAEWMRSRLLVRMSVRLDESMHSRVFDATFEQRLNRSDKSAVQSFGDLTNVRQFLTGNGIFAFFDAPWTPIYLLVLFLMHPLLGGVALGGAVLLGCMARLTDRKTLKPLDRANEASVQANTYLYSKLRNSEVVESMGMLGDLRRRWLGRHHAQLRLHSEAHDLGHRIQALTKFIRYSLQSLILGAGALLVIDGQLTPGAMVVGGILMGRALAPVELIIGSWRAFASARTSFRRLETLLGDHPERNVGVFHGTPSGHVQLQEVAVTVANRQQPILDGISLDLPVGEVIGVVGPSGSGKSTLARVILGICPEVGGGRVLLDGEPLSGWSREELGPYIGYLPQDVQLFEGTVAENIARFGQVDPQAVIRAAQLAGVHDMVLRFAKGYDTPVGEGGSYLSGGQRQRIALARAIYGDPSLIVLDEPNSSLDDLGEQALVGAIQALRKEGKTVILITHRPAILGVVDRILVLNQGRVQRYGSRQEVLAALRPAPPQPAAA